MTPEQIAAGLTSALVKFWCDWTHGGGDVRRDELDRINWRCRKCGRWSDIPASPQEERAALLERPTL